MLKEFKVSLLQRTIIITPKQLTKNKQDYLFLPQPTFSWRQIHTLVHPLHQFLLLLQSLETVNKDLSTLVIIWSEIQCTMSWQLTTVKTKCSFSFCSSFLHCSTSFYLENTYGGSLKCINNNKARSQCRELHSLLSITSHANQYREDAGDKAYGLSSSSNKSRIWIICRCHGKGSTFSSVI